MKPFHNLGQMMRALLKRDWVKFIVWILAVLAYAASGAGKFVTLVHTDAQRSAMYNMFANPAMKSLFGPIFINNYKDFTAAVAFGTTMPMLTALVFAIVSIIYVVNRTRKDEDEGIAEMFRSFQIGKLSNTAAVVIELLILQVLITVLLAGAIQGSHVEGLTDFSSNLLFAASIGGQGFIWGMVALVLAQVFSDAGTAKGATLGLMGGLYVIRMGTDYSNYHTSVWNPVSWSYLTEVYVNNYWWPILATVILSAVMVALAFFLETKRDVGAGFIPEGNGKAHAGWLLKSFPGFAFRQQRTATIGWLIGIFALGITYGSMAGRIGSFIQTTPAISQMFNINPALAKSASDAAAKEMVNSFMSTIFMVIAVLAVCFAVTSLNRMVSEERKNRLEELYATPLSRFKLYFSYTAIAWVLGAVAQFVGAVALYLGQMGSSHALGFVDVVRPAMVWIVGIFFILSLLSLLMAFLPRLSAIIWAYIGFVFFMSYIGGVLHLPTWVDALNIFHEIPRLPIDSMNWGNVSMILIAAVVLTIIGFIGYRNRDLISE